MTHKLIKRRKNWATRFQELVAFQRNHGHCRVPYNSRESPLNPLLGAWVSGQRWRYRKKRLPAEQQRQLQALGLIWDPAREAWEARFAELQRFHRRFGHGRVPYNSREHSSLYYWLIGQRQHWKHRTPDERRRLLQIGFHWRQVKRQNWETRFAELAAFQGRHGHCLVSSARRNNPDTTLGRWVEIQRERRYRLRPWRRQRLEAIGFIWDVHMAAWEKRLKELKAFRKRFGHCHVSGRWPDNPPLAYWVMEQRKLYQLKRLPPQRQRQLAALGFAWRRNRPRRK